MEQGAADGARMVQEVCKNLESHHDQLDPCRYWRCRHDIQHFGPTREGKIRVRSLGMSGTAAEEVRDSKGRLP